MKPQIVLHLASLTLAGALLCGNAFGEDEKLKVLIIDGQNTTCYMNTIGGSLDYNCGCSGLTGLII